MYDSILWRAVSNLVLSDSTRNIYISDSDTIFEEKNFKYYPKLGFNKYGLKQEDFAHINLVFCAKSGGELVSASCIPIYRDHLVFKRKSKIVGHIFVCLSCM